MMQGARICPRCSTRVDERRAKASPYCLRCGAPLGTSAPTGPMAFSGKQPGSSGGSALPWILGAVGLVALVGLGGVVALVVIASRDDEPAGPVVVAGQPKIEVPTAAPLLDAGVPVATTAPTVRSPTPRPPSTTATSRPTSIPVPFPTPTQPSGPPDAGIVALGPFPRAKAQNEVDRVASGLASCKRSSGPFGTGTIRVDFEPDGRVGTLSRPPFAGTPVGSCISARFLSIRIGAFQGSTQQIEKPFIIQE